MADAAKPNILVIWGDASFTIDQPLEKIEAAITAHR
jgi:hypothetical protein